MVEMQEPQVPDVVGLGFLNVVATGWLHNVYITQRAAYHRFSAAYYFIYNLTSGREKNQDSIEKSFLQ
jgi:hypothetical protein